MVLKCSVLEILLMIRAEWFTLYVKRDVAQGKHKHTVVPILHVTGTPSLPPTLNKHPQDPDPIIRS